MANPVINVWLKTPRKAWRNDGGPVPRGFRGVCRWRGTPKRPLLKTDRSEVVRKGDWVVIAGGDVFAFSPAQMRQLYSRVPL